MKHKLSYIKSRFTSDHQNVNSLNNRDKDKRSLASVSPMHSVVQTNPFAQTPTPNVLPLTHPSPNNAAYDRHRSPDPPPRLTRGNQSPLILRRKLELAQSGSPLLPRR